MICTNFVKHQGQVATVTKAAVEKDSNSAIKNAVKV